MAEKRRKGYFKEVHNIIFNILFFSLFMISFSFFQFYGITAGIHFFFSTFILLEKTRRKKIMIPNYNL